MLSKSLHADLQPRTATTATAAAQHSQSSATLSKNQAQSPGYKADELREYHKEKEGKTQHYTIAICDLFSIPPCLLGVEHHAMHRNGLWSCVCSSAASHRCSTGCRQSCHTNPELAPTRKDQMQVLDAWMAPAWPHRLPTHLKSLHSLEQFATQTAAPDPSRASPSRLC